MRVLIVDDHAVLRDGLKNILDEPRGTAVCHEASTAQEAVQSVERQEWDLVVLDISLGEISGLDVLKRIRQMRPKLPILIFTMHPERQYARRSLKAGASGYVTKDSSPTELRQAIRQVVAGRRYVSPSLAETLVADLEAGEIRQPHESLSDREFEVMRLIASGKTVGEIAALLSLSDRTVSTYRARILEKMGMRTNAELTHYAVQSNLTM
ncbi:MAG TPA: response regulator transcription factor [Vicinamibacterales bacterium]|nr:response regulator transcription factor [Vicinamibacterales bacterium]